ncbi:carboxymuconolactone decarboxylase family protein [Umezawaea tangerina]|uniref:AhpD family alkylhydroperoxidase n=1 Tax=Umezawaea tangerina TaxID=84725 RepID=A0A2T0TG89_9PSEU|nr:carboxymuconolactone decarboxylase family protein [Umezawaea tangerina]PRY44651.1 AhpD family alkylhydroperoxidase [Umezawaea tangerina]
MTTFPVHTTESAPDSARGPLEALQGAFGFVPNVAGVMAGSPPLVNSFFSAFGQFRGAGTFSPAERQVLLLSNAVANDCAWAVAFHSLEALLDGVDPDAVEALRRRELPDDPRLAALSTLTRALIDNRGHLGEGDVKAFTEAGFSGSQVLEVITGVAISTMTNHAANVARPPLEPQIGGHAWTGGY